MVTSRNGSLKQLTLELDMLGFFKSQVLCTLWKSARSRSREISHSVTSVKAMIERRSGGISSFCSFWDVGSSWGPAFHQSQPRLFGGVLSVAIDHRVLGIVPGARCWHLVAASATFIWKWNTGTLQTVESIKDFHWQNATRCLRESFQSCLSEDGLGSVLIYSIQTGRWRTFWRFFTDSLLQQ